MHQFIFLVLHVEDGREPEIFDSRDRCIGKALPVVLDGVEQQRRITTPVLLHAMLRTVGQHLAALRQ